MPQLTEPGILLLGAVVALLFAYLLYALFRPEKF
jgi:K+-transporting ATPase KdpF subunit